MKACRKCEVKKPLSEYYRHSRMADGHLNECKECKKALSRQRADSDEVRARERIRARQPHRVKARLDYQRTNRKVRNAHNAVYRAVQAGTLLKPDRCSACGVECDPEGHHDNYDKPLDVRWLCRACHQQHHAMEKVI